MLLFKTGCKSLYQPRQPFKSTNQAVCGLAKSNMTRLFSTTKSDKEEIVIKGAESEMVFPYAFMNTDRDLVLPGMLCPDDPTKLAK